MILILLVAPKLGWRERAEKEEEEHAGARG